MAGRPGFIDINQYPRQGFTHAYWQYRRRICAASDTRAYRAGHQAFRHIRYRLKTGGAGAAYAIGIGMNIHPRTQHNFARNIGGFRHLYYLTKNQLLNGIGWNFTARQQLAYHHLAEINSGNTMKCSGLTSEGVRNPLTIAMRSP